ncbi:hypothetical protein NO1_2200 [Candidatus Termititenax aidoneus]|uniref:Uncharacterized protein n=1 Tax=Termititenax aidoneus TaxID=2218524 RepID=A0A388TF07_TERA1|nr:hypothetical protein NO1_2200 [Candidatus Termititenax aidoneus]
MATSYSDCNHRAQGQTAGYINHLNYSDNAATYENSVTYTANTYQDYKNYGYYCYEFIGHGDGYNDRCSQYYTNYSACSQIYNNHQDSIRTAPAAYTLPISTTTPDGWTTLSSAIEDLKTLRDEIQKIAETKVKKAASGVRPVIDFNTTKTENADAQFGYHKLARAAQINETITNIENLYQAIKGTGSGLASKTAGVSPRKKQDYKEIISKAQDLASEEQTKASGYANYNEQGSYTATTYRRLN